MSVLFVEWGLFNVKYDASLEYNKRDKERCFGVETEMLQEKECKRIKINHNFESG